MNKVNLIEKLKLENSVVREKKIEFERPKTIKISPHTPKKYGIKSPKTPVRNFDDNEGEDDFIDSKEILNNYRYEIIKYLVDKNYNVLYAICFDPNGQIVFIKIKNKEKRDDKTYIINECDNEPELGSYQKNLLNKINTESFGIVFYNEGSYIFFERLSNLEYKKKYFLLENQIPVDFLNLTDSYLIILMEDIKKEPYQILDSTNKNYQIIQYQQELTQENIFNNLAMEIDSFNNSIQKFYDEYEGYIRYLSENYTVLNTLSKKLYKKYGKSELTEDENEKYKKISKCMYAIFKNYNEQIYSTEKIHNIINEVSKLKHKFDIKKKEIEEIKNNINIEFNYLIKE